jgi:ATP-dependent protease Clp ATPase subunit
VTFCGKSDAEVARLFAGPGAMICNECVRLLAAELDRDGEPPPSPRAPVTQGPWKPIPHAKGRR